MHMYHLNIHVTEIWKLSFVDKLDDILLISYGFDGLILTSAIFK